MLPTGNTLTNPSGSPILQVCKTQIRKEVIAVVKPSLNWVNSPDIRKKAADDLRFLLGAKFDVGKITTYLTGHAF